MSWYGVFMTWAILNEVLILAIFTGRVGCPDNSES
ncbi:hypothetical protein V1290_000026 [Bradyrhizobium sp. AZCC 1578]